MGLLATSIIFLCAQLIPSTLAFSWGKPRSHVPNAEVTSIAGGRGSALHDLASVGLKPDEVETLFLQSNALDDYTRKPDCFRRAAGLVRGRCGEADMDEDERVKAAIALTLCEVATARHHSVPMECVPLGSGAQGAPGDCVEALSRSAQFWSSYSGYLREVPQLCYAFRRWNDIDTAKDIYRNATLEKLALIRLLVDREKSLKRTQEQWESLRIDTATLLGDLRESALGFNEGSQVVLRALSEVLQDGSMSLRASLFDVEQRLETGIAQHLLRMGTVEEALAEKHALSLSLAVQSVEHSLSSALEKSFVALDERTEGILSLTRDTSHLLESMVYNFASMQQTIGRLSDSAVEAAYHLEVHSQQAVTAQKMQIEATLSVEELSHTVRLLTSVAHSELENINNTADALRESLRLAGASWFRSTFVPLVQLVMHVDAAYWDDLYQLPIVRVGIGLVRVGCYLSRSVFSSMMVLVFLSSSARAL